MWRGPAACYPDATSRRRNDDVARADAHQRRRAAWGRQRQEHARRERLRALLAGPSPPIHQVIRTVPPPLLGSIAFGLLYGFRR